MIKGPYCDICKEDAIEGEYRILELNRHEYDDEFIRICKDCDESY
tara:strand:- start:12800 stop:12934 length:135 start_codon:yes stop_codon:yes gene_type:complete